LGRRKKDWKKTVLRRRRLRRRMIGSGSASRLLALSLLIWGEKRRSEVK
jgi:hypothetical protein